MLSIKYILVLTSCLAFSEALFFDGGVTVVGGGAALAALLGLKAAAIGGFALGAALSSRRRSRPSYRKSYRKSYRRYGRSVEEDEDDRTELLLTASLNDAEDCAKKLVCTLNAQDFNTLDTEERAIAILFGQAENIDVTAVTVEFDLAAHMGRKAGESQCQMIYSRCPYQTKDLMEVIRQPNAYYNQL